MEKYCDNWEIAFYDVFNEAYQSYLNNISPNVFMHIYLEKIIKITESSAGFIASINVMNQKRYMSLEAVNNKFFNFDELTVPSDLLLDIDEYDYIYTIAIKQNKIIIDNDFKDLVNINTCICIPYSFNDKLIGIITLANRSSYVDNNQFKLLGNLTAVLKIIILKERKPV